MTTIEAFSNAYRHTMAAQRRAASGRKPALTVAATAIATAAAVVAAWAVRARRPVLYVAGFGFLDFAAWGVHYLLGCAAIGLTLFVLDALTSGGDGK